MLSFTSWNVIMTILLGLFLSLVFGFGLGLWIRRARAARATRAMEMVSASPPPAPVIYQDLETCKKIIAGLDATDYFLYSSLEPLESRAGPNQRLVRVFGIDNSFTTTDVEYHVQFRRQVELLLRIGDRRWKSLAQTVAEVTRNDLRGRTVGMQYGMFLVPFVQAVVLKFSIHALFSVPMDQLDDAAVATITSNINSLWISSKSSRASPSMQTEQNALFAALRTVLPHATGPRENPLNFILPAYETMWRIVLRCFLELQFRSGDDSPAWRRVLAGFLRDPTRVKYESIQADGGGLSARFIVDETLRLYPPTRRIYRHKSETGINPELVAADIEYLHRDPSIWGEDALFFKPSRWRETSESQREAFLPFGSKPFTCPAKGDAGPRMIAVLVSALLEVFNDGWECKGTYYEDSIDGDRAGSPLKLGRDSYTTLRVIKEAA